MSPGSGVTLEAVAAENLRPGLIRSGEKDHCLPFDGDAAGEMRRKVLETKVGVVTCKPPMRAAFVYRENYKITTPKC
jgi:hypothetical protein